MPNRGARQRKQWKSMGTGISQSASTNVTGIVAGAVSDTQPFTVLRIIGEYVISPGASNVVGDQMIVSLGIGVFSLDAIALGGTAVPDPEAEPDFPWLFWASHSLSTSQTGFNTSGDPQMGLRRRYDIRSMRKVKPREGLAMVFEFRDVNGAPTIDLTWVVNRVLIGVGS